MSPLRNIDDVRERIAASPVDGSPDAMRRAFAALAGPQRDARRASFGGTDALVVGDGPRLVWLHGGGGVFGAPDTHVNLAHALADGGVEVVLPRYPLAPEASFDAMLESVADVLEATGAAALGGDSFGGQLALVSALQRPVDRLALLSPNTDRTGRSATRAALSARDAMNDDAADAALARLVFGERDPAETAQSPALADLSALPPSAIEVGSEEVLLGDSLLLAERAALAGRPAALRLTPGLFHLASLWPDAIPEAGAMARRLGAFAAAG